MWKILQYQDDDKIEAMTLLLAGWCCFKACWQQNAKAHYETASSHLFMNASICSRRPPPKQRFDWQSKRTSYTKVVLRALVIPMFSGAVQTCKHLVSLIPQQMMQTSTRCGCNYSLPFWEKDISLYAKLFDSIAYGFLAQRQSHKKYRNWQEPHWVLWRRTK